MLRISPSGIFWYLRYQMPMLGTHTQYKTVGVQWFAVVWFPHQLFLGGYERSPKTQPFHIVKR
jgi:hypothetical protein